MKKRWKKCLAILFMGCLLMGEVEPYTVMAAEKELQQEVKEKEDSEEVEQKVVEDTNEQGQIQTNEDMSSGKVSEEKKKTKNLTKSTGNVKAAGNWEKENNDSYSQANPISPNTVYYGTGDGSYFDSDADYFKITLPSDGVVSLTINHQLQDDDSRKFYIWLGDTKTTYIDDNSYGYDTTVTSNKVGLKKGTYYVVVKGEEGLEYNFKVNYTASSLWEKETNDAYSEANPISPNTVYYGTGDGSYFDSDADYFKITLPSDGVVSLTINHQLQDDDSRKFYIWLGDTKTTYIDDNSYGYDTTVTSNKVGLKKGTYYVVVKGEEGLEYNFKVNYTSTSTYETETNDVFSTADSINLDTKYTANLGDSSDKDYFTFTLKDTTWVNLYFTHKKFTDCNQESSYEVTLYNSSGRQVLKDASGYKFETLKSEALDKTSSWGAIQLKPGKYYLGVTGYRYASNLLGRDYQFVLNKVNMKQPKITSIKATGYNKAKIKWQQVKGADRYFIYRGTSKKNLSFWAVEWDPTVTSYTDTGLECGKKYYYQVVAGVYTTKFVSKKSKLVSVRPTLSKPQVSAKTKGKKQIKISWKKVKGASGYEIYRSTSSKGKYKKIKTIKNGSICSFTNKKLKSKKTYYYKVRAYRVVNNKKVYSGKSNVVAKQSK